MSPGQGDGQHRCTPLDADAPGGPRTAAITTHTLDAPGATISYDVRGNLGDGTPLLPDREALAAAIEDMHQTYRRAGLGPAMAKFIVLVSHDGELPAGYRYPPVDPAQFGLPAEDDGSRDDALLGQNLRSCTGYQPDVDALRASSTRIVAAHGEASGQTMAARGADAVAATIGAELVTFPGDHSGFLGGEYGMQGEPDAFAKRLREVLDGG